MDYGQIIKRSWEIVKKNKFLWWLGVLAAFAGGFGSPSFNFSGLRGFPSSDSSNNANLQSGEFPKQFSDAFSNVNIPAVIAIVAIALVLILIVYFAVLYFSLSAKAGLVTSVDKIEKEGNAIGFRSAMREGRKYFWKLFGLGWLICLGMLVLILPLVALIFLLVFWHPVAAVVGLGLLIFVCFLAIIVLSFLVSIVAMFTQMMIVLENKKVFSAIRDSYELLKRNLKDVIIGYAIMLGVNVLIGIVMILLIGAVVVIGSILAGVFYLIGGVIATIVCVIVLIPVCLGFFMVMGGLITAFTLTYWTLFYRALKYIDEKKSDSGVAKNNFAQAAIVQ
jgi:glycerophosphoryl diester phosphodiesterase